MTDTSSAQACKGWQCLTRVPDNPEKAGWRDGYCPECQDELARDEIRAERQDARNEVKSPTPITDAFLERINGILMIDHYAETAKHAKDLERQLAGAREENQRLTADMILHERMSIRFMEQRDRLAEALRNLMAVIDSHDIQTEDCDRRGHLYCDCLHRARKPALAALAALDRKEPE